MKRELLSKAFGSIDDRFVLEAYHPVGFLRKERTHE